jgi:hypothetical protein
VRALRRAFGSTGTRSGRRRSSHTSAANAAPTSGAVTRAGSSRPNRMLDRRVAQHPVNRRQGGRAPCHILVTKFVLTTRGPP